MSLHFDGITSFCEYVGSLVTAYPITMFAWVKPANTTQTACLFGVGKNGSGKEMAALQVTTAIRANIRDGSGSGYATATTAASTAWTPCLITFTSATSRKIRFGAGAVVTDTVNNTAVISDFDRVKVGQRPYDATLMGAMDVAEFTSWSADLTAQNYTDLAAGALPETIATGSLIECWPLLTQAATHTGVNGRVLTATSTTQGATHPITRTGPTTIPCELGTATAAGFAASIIGAVTIACSLGGATASGHQASISSGVTISATLGTAIASGNSASVVSSGSATITTDVFKNNTGTVLASTSIPKLAAIKLSDMTVAASWTSQVTDGSGVLSLTGAMTAATDYLLVVSSTDGASVGVKKYTAA